MKAAVIGGAGRMGFWFAKYLRSIDYEVIISDLEFKRAEEAARKLGISCTHSNIDAIKKAQLIILSVPVSTMSKSIIEILPALKSGQILVDIASFKETHFSLLGETSKKGVVPLSVHPMFGPAATSLDGLTVALIPVIDLDREYRLALDLFQGVNLVQISSQEHDDAMAKILSLTYLINLAFAATVKEKGLNSIRKLAGTSFMVQLGLSSSIVGEDIKLVETLLHSNSYAESVYSKFQDYFNQLRIMCRDETSEFIKDLRSSDGMKIDYLSVNKWRHQAYERFKEIVESISVPEDRSQVS